MSTPITPITLPCYVAGEAVDSGPPLDVQFPYDGSLAGQVRQAGRADMERACQAAARHRSQLTRHQRSEILRRAGQLLSQRRNEFAEQIVHESGLCIREAHYEVGRASDVLEFAAGETLLDDGQIFSCDVTASGPQRKIFTLREPLRCMAAITPFNHPLNQVVHKLAPAVAANVPAVLKPSEKTPLTAIRFCQLLYEAGLPGPMLSVLVGPLDEVVRPLIQDPHVELVSFTGSAAVGKQLAALAGYKKTCLELGGNSPLIVMEDAELSLAVKLAAEGCFRNSGQRCTAVKRLLVQRSLLDRFVPEFVALAATYLAGDPRDEATRVGTVIDEQAARTLEQRVSEAEQQGARLLLGGRREGALLEPTVLTDVPRRCTMVVEESFGPLAPIIAFDDLQDAIELANDSAFGLSSGIVTQRLDWALSAVKGIRTGTVNVNQVPGYRTELSPFGGVKDSGLGIKEGVREAIKFMTNIKTFSLPW